MFSLPRGSNKVREKNYKEKEVKMDSEEVLFHKCAKIYENGRDGQYAVIGYCEGIYHSNWGHCEDCEATTPFVHRNGEKKCLVCSFGNIVE